MRRSTIGKNTSSLKQRQLSHLHAQLAQLEANLADFETHMKTTVHQAEHIKKLAIMHGSLLMSTHKVFEEVQDEVADGRDAKDEEEVNGEAEAEEQEEGQWEDQESAQK